MLDPWPGVCFPAALLLPASPPRQHFVIATEVRSMMARAKEASLSGGMKEASLCPFHLISGKYLLSRGAARCS